VQAGSDYVGRVPTHGPGDAHGEYVFYLTKRPNYCDRGDWLIHLDYEGDQVGNSVDGADGFPRFFFGDADAAKDQMEEWVRRRKGCQHETQEAR
jgi:hypothetical protein